MKIKKRPNRSDTSDWVFSLEVVTGIEPAMAVLQTGALPLGYTTKIYLKFYTTNTYYRRNVNILQFNKELSKMSRNMLTSYGQYFAYVISVFYH